MKTFKRWFGRGTLIVVSLGCLYVRPSAQDAILPFSADLTVRRGGVSADDRPLLTVERRFRYERVRKRGRWQTEFTILAAAPQKDLPPGVVGNIPSSLDGARVEDDGTGVLRVIDGSGRELKMPLLSEVQQQLGVDPADAANPSALDAMRERLAGSGRISKARPTPGQNWLEGMMLRMDHGAARVSRLERKFRRAGTVRGLQRFLIDDKAETHELLVDGGLGVVLESNTIENGVLTAHATYGYQQSATGHLFKTRTRTERLTADGRSRTLFELEWSNVRLGAAGGQR